MTVKELIDELSKYDPTIDVRFIGESDEVIGSAKLEPVWYGEDGPNAVYLRSR